ncbi:hypothetical protein QJ48_06815 [Paenibacillus sp. A3]|uniref:hypothetical protein n=1 Tax=Paenibacillus sp. A3 TaxID=1337054 RepID=UPI0006D56F11|nr:hypothetical protein [Paenibacillus sp. A3]KPV60217.1 hypothetical protein QJ48_06815 [Paenibacillus sp. A3]
MRDACRIAWNELKHKYIALLANVLFSALIGFFLAHDMVRALVGDERGSMQPGVSFPVDLWLIAVVPTLGALAFSREYLSFSYLVSEEPFLKRLRFFRMWAIPPKVIAWSRMLYMMMCLGTSLLVFVSVFVASSWSALLGKLSVAEYAAFVFVWIGYAFAVSGINPYLEFGTNGKAILIGAFTGLPLIVAAILTFYSHFGQPVYLWVFEWARGNPPVAMILSVLVAVLGVAGFYRALIYRLARKDLP